MRAEDGSEFSFLFSVWFSRESEEGRKEEMKKKKQMALKVLRLEDTVREMEERDSS